MSSPTAEAGQPRPSPAAHSGHSPRAAHLGLGAFARAHPLWYTWRAGQLPNAPDAPDAPDWTYTGFTGRTPTVAQTLARQDFRYTVLQRGPDGDSAEVVDVLAAAHAAGDTNALLDLFAHEDLGIVTLTVTEAGYRRRTDGELDRDDPAVAADLAELGDADRRGRAPGPLATVPARLVAGLAARRDAGASGLAVLSCDNLAANGPTLRRVVIATAAAVPRSGRYAGLTDWLDRNVSFPATMVDRIVPKTGAGDIERAAQLTGWTDPATVVAEPFAEWVIAGDFPAGRPGWGAVGAELVDDVSPYEDRKLWLLNGGHSLLAYTGPARGHTTIAEAAGDRNCRADLDALWDCIGPFLRFPPEQISAYREQLLDRFTNPGIRHELAQVGGSGSQKLAVRIVPLVRRFLDRGQPVPAPLTGVLGAWLAHLRGLGFPVDDPRADDFVNAAQGPVGDAARAVLTKLAPDLADSAAVVSAVADASIDLERLAATG